MLSAARPRDPLRGHPVDFNMAMLPYWSLLFAVGVISGYLNVLAGGGSVLTLPVLIFLGLDGALANGTNRVAILIQNIASASEFQRSRGYPVRTVLTYSLWTLPGAIAGAFYATSVSNELFQTILGFVILGVVVTLLIPRARIFSPVAHTGLSRSRWIYRAAGDRILRGFMQVGVGFCSWPRCSTS